MLLRTIPGVGPVTASAIVATAGDGHQFRNGSEFAAWLGLTPINRSSGGKERFRTHLQDGRSIPQASSGHWHDCPIEPDEGQS